jgi:hypothetical protein
MTHKQQERAMTKGGGIRLIPCFLLLFAAAAGAASGEKVVFKPVIRAILKVDEKPAKTWDVYQGEKHAHLVLVQLGGRFLLLETKAKEVFELDPASLQRKNDELRWEDTKRRASEEQNSSGERAGTQRKKLLPSEDWTFRSVGPLMIVRLRLAAEGRVIEVQLPQRPDFRWAY